MTLFHCIDYANICGIKTLNEAVIMTEQLASSLFTIGNIKEEMTELYNDIRKYNISDYDMELTDILDIINNNSDTNKNFLIMFSRV